MSASTRWAAKASWRELAIFGGTPTFDLPLHVNRPNVGERSLFDRLVTEAWENRWFTNNGPLVQRLELELQAFLGVRHCIITSSGTSALAVLVKAMDLKGEIIIPSFTFVSTAHTLAWSGIVPVFCDIEEDTWNIDCDHCERLVTSRTSAIIATHIWGRPCNIEALQDLADRRGIALIFDAAHAFGCTHDHQPIGRFGDAAVFSFHANKAFHCGEGGAVTTDDDVLASRLRATRNFGFTGYDRVDGVGTNAKLPEISAALGLANLRKYQDHVSRARDCYLQYQSNLERIPEIDLQTYDGEEKQNFHYISCLVNSNSTLSRDDIVALLHAENILARRYFYPGCHLMEPYRTMFPNVEGALPRTSAICANTIVLPGGAAISSEQIDAVCDTLKLLFENAEPIKRRLHATL